MDEGDYLLQPPSLVSPFPTLSALCAHMWPRG